MNAHDLEAPRDAAKHPEASTVRPAWCCSCWAAAWSRANVQQLGQAAGRRWRADGRRPVLGVDETQLKVKGEGITLGFVTDPDSGQIVALELLASRQAAEMERWLSELLERLGCEVVVSDDLESYKPALDAMGREHQLCLAHARKALANRLKKIPGYERQKEVLRRRPARTHPAGQAPSAATAGGLCRRPAADQRPHVVWRIRHAHVHPAHPGQLAAPDVLSADIQRT